MREEGRRIDGIDLLRGFADGFQRIAVLPVAIGGGRIEAILEHFRDRRTRFRRPFALVPDDRKRIERLLGAPPRIGDDSHGGVLHPHHLLHAGHAGDLALVITLQLAAKYRAGLDGGVEHAGQFQIDGKDLAAVELVRGIEPLERLAGDLPVLGILQLDGFQIRRRQLRGVGCDLAVTDRTLARPMRDDAVGYGEFADRHIPLFGRGLQQHQARRRPAAPDIVLRRADAAAPAGAHLAPGALAGEIAARRDAFGRHLFPVALQFFGDELCEPRQRSLAHLRARDTDHAGVVGLDRNPDVDFGRGALRLRRAYTERHVQSEGQTAACDCGGADDELAAREFRAVCEDQLFMASLPRPGGGADAGGQMHRLADALIGAASADIGHRFVDVLVGRLGIFLQERRGRHDLPGLAIAALRNVDRRPCLLHGVRCTGRQPLDGDDHIGGLDVAHGNRTGPLHLVVDVNRAGAALGDAAAVLGAGQADLLPNHPEQRRVRPRPTRLLPFR